MNRFQVAAVGPFGWRLLWTQPKIPRRDPTTKIFQDAMDVFQAKKGLSQPPHTDWLWIPGEAAISKING